MSKSKPGAPQMAAPSQPLPAHRLDLGLQLVQQMPVFAAQIDEPLVAPTANPAIAMPSSTRTA